jgi:hypothetical protein
VEIRTGYEIKEENLKQGQKRMQSVINELDTGEMLINEKQEAESSNCKELHAAINDHKMVLQLYCPLCSSHFMLLKSNSVECFPTPLIFRTLWSLAFLILGCIFSLHLSHISKSHS